VDLGKENNQYLDQLETKKNQMMSRQSPSKFLASDNDKEKKKLVEYKQMNEHSDQLRAMKDDQMMNQCTEDNGV
jgi:hypothetical protein